MSHLVGLKLQARLTKVSPPRPGPRRQARHSEQTGSCYYVHRAHGLAKTTIRIDWFHYRQPGRSCQIGPRGVISTAQALCRPVLPTPLAVIGGSRRRGTPLLLTVPQNGPQSAPLKEG